MYINETCLQVQAATYLLHMAILLPTDSGLLAHASPLKLALASALAAASPGVTVCGVSFF